ncbi:hypothetical protein K469DRAFT_717214 [Zopfia rhizophila CBS 207.26]|uniref:Rhodopsin domain-containing protein n=1 Tax=Zopfia rhizophila CBS 207.26 TaxID=1314779 RepID=A0A6A6ENM5_9PEZI|nr:hypothetical protein K469DRAFT_717214 [Zopfia rhizophila CBS 207.26]
MGEKQVLALVFCTFLLILCLVFIAARLYVRCFMLHNAGKDDLFCLLAGILNIVETAFMFLEVKYGAGQRMTQLTNEEIEKQRFAVYISMPPYYIGLMFIKMSIIYQYRRFFSEIIGTICYAILALVVSTTITWICLSAFQCTPARGFWIQSLHNNCLNLSTINYSFLAVNSATDIMLLILPMPTFFKLRLRKAEKRALIGIFGLGGFAALTSLLRIPYIVFMDQGGDPIYHGFGIIVWTRVEMSISIICACLPCLRAPLAKWFPAHWGSESASRESSDYPSGFFFRSRKRRRSGINRLDSRSGNAPSTFDLQEEYEMGIIQKGPIIPLAEPIFNHKDTFLRSSDDKAIEKEVTVTTTTQQINSTLGIERVAEIWSPN